MLREDLAAVEDRLRRLREERGRMNKLLSAAKSAAQENKSDAAVNAALAAKEACEQVDQQLAQEAERQTQLLKQLGDREVGAGFGHHFGGDGWAEAARRLNLERGDLRVDVSAAALLQPILAPTPRQAVTSPAQGAAGGVAPVTSNRHLYPALASSPFAQSGDLASTDFKVALSMQEAAVSGQVEVETASDTTKAVIAPPIELAVPIAETFALVAEALPAQLWDNRDALRAALANRIGRQLSDSYDAHLIGKLESDSGLPNGSTGATLPERIRRAVADMRDLGGEPSVLALSSADSASLDLFEDSAGNLVFSVRSVNSGSPIWNLEVREAEVEAPLLVDAVAVGLSYYGQASVVADPYTGLKVNQVRVRVEAEMVWHTRDISVGAFQIS
ncbi:MAG: hypothetical protein ACRDMH_00390 [Solirubrobacterales bacterium]